MQVTDIFHSQTHPRLQLLVRYIHPQQSVASDERLNQLPNRHSTYISTRPSRRLSTKSSDGQTEPIPITLTLLGNHYSLNQQLFKMLTSEEPLLSPSCSGNGDFPSPVSSLVSMGGGGVALGTQVSETGSSLLERGGGGGMDAEQAELGRQDVATPLEPVQHALAQHRRGRTSTKDILYDSDEYIVRAIIPSGKFDIDPELPEFNSKKDEQAMSEPTTPMRPPVHRQVSTPPEVVVRRYILQMLRPEVDRQFTHIFLKSSGIFLIVVSLEEIIAEPLIQFENLFYLLRLIHTHMKPADLKRVIVVGMYHSSLLPEHHRYRLLQCVNHLNAAVRAAQMNQNYGLPLKEGGFVFLFDCDHPKTELLYLCACIRSLMDVFMDRAWHFRRNYYEAIFMPFENFGKVLVRLTSASRRKVVESLASIRRHVGSDVPDKYYETLAMLSPAFIDRSEEMGIGKNLSLDVHVYIHVHVHVCNSGPCCMSAYTCICTLL